MNAVEDAVCLGVPGPGHGGGLALLQVGQHQEGQQRGEEHRGHELGAADAEPALPGVDNTFFIIIKYFFRNQIFFRTKILLSSNIFKFCIIHLSSWLLDGGSS